MQPDVAFQLHEYFPGYLGMGPARVAVAIAPGSIRFWSSAQEGGV